MPACDARFIPDNDRIPNGNRHKHYSAHRSQTTTVGRNKGQQIRIKRYASDGITLLDFAFYTVIDVHDEDLDVVFMDFKDPESTHYYLRDRLVLARTDLFTDKIDSQATNDSEFTKHLTDNGRHRELIVITPHGDMSETHTGKQAECVTERLSSECVFVWFCAGLSSKKTSCANRLDRLWAIALTHSSLLMKEGHLCMSI